MEELSVVILASTSASEEYQQVCMLLRKHVGTKLLVDLFSFLPVHFA